MTARAILAASVALLAWSAAASAAPEANDARKGAAPVPPPRPATVQGAAPAVAPAVAPAPAAKPAPARGGGLLPGGESRDPIQIDADKLEWFDREQKAIYTGGVVAKQGEATLKASQLRIFLKKPEKDAVSRSTAQPSGPGGDNQIERMEADGPVELIQKEQTATGDSGLYERGANAVTLIGNVALRQGGHVTYGDRLVYDLDTRQAVVQNPRGTFQQRNAPAAAPKR